MKPRRYQLRKDAVAIVQRRQTGMHMIVVSVVVAVCVLVS